MTIDTLKQLLHREGNSHKYDFGHVLIVGGGPGMVGAPFLAGKAALRSGAGLVTIASRAEVIDKLEARVEELMTLRVPLETAEAYAMLNSFIHSHKVTTIVLGPGQAEDFSAIDIEILKTQDIPIIIDGGALAALSKDITLLPKLGRRNNTLILTPHAGEYKKLTNTSVPQDPPERKHLAQNFAKTNQVTLVLKGHRTLVAHPDGTCYENTTGNPGMATAGTGDSLSGIIAALVAQKIDLSEAVEAGVYLHGFAGDLAAELKTEPGMLTSDLIGSIPAALKAIELLSL